MTALRFLPLVAAIVMLFQGSALAYIGQGSLDARVGARMATKKPKSAERDTPSKGLEETAVVRVVVPTAADLTDEQRAIAAELGVPDLDAYAQTLARSSQGVVYARRADESDDAHALRCRHREALGFAHAMVLKLEALRPVAEHPGAALEPSDPDVHDLAMVLGAIEAARGRYLGATTPASTLIAAVRDALEHARRWAERRRKDPPVTDECGVTFGVLEVDPDVVREEAIRTAPELAVVPLSDWKRAIADWPGLLQGFERKKRIRPRPLPAQAARVIMALLSPHGLCATNVRAVQEALEGAARRAKRRK